MPKSLNLIKNRLSGYFKERGAKAEIRKKTGFSGSQLDRYISGESDLGVEQLDRLAEALGIQPWELIKPDGTMPTPAPESPALEPLLEAIRRLEARVKELETLPTKAVVKHQPILIDDDAVRLELANFIAKVDKAELPGIRITLKWLLDEFKKSSSAAG